MTALPGLRQLPRDLSLSAVVAGIISLLVGVSSSIGLIFQTAHDAGLSNLTVTSWLTATGLGIGIAGTWLCLRYRAPVVVVWSTPGLALIAGLAGGLSFPEMVGAFIVCAVVIALLGYSGLFERITRLIPAPLASALLAGILLMFPLRAFAALPAHPYEVGAMLLAYLIGRVWTPRWAVPLALVAGVAAAALTGAWHLPGAGMAALGSLHLTVPHFTLAATLQLALPLALVTMTGQNLPGSAVLRASGYERVPLSPVIGATGLASLAIAPFGAPTLNLAAITAAICAGEEAHPDVKRRYVAGLVSSLAYLLLAVFAGGLTAFVGSLPVPLITALAGFALIGTVTSNLQSALAEPHTREAAALTLLVTASGVTALGLGSAFWGISLGMVVYWLLRRGKL